ncbi:hypothetical protein HN011_001425 [Eciton burchellii]|nr:hypothetical protein HN011_001425 [Eciton burchellii]
MKKESPSETLLSFIHSDRLEQGEGRLRRNISENYRGRKKEKEKENYEKRWSLIVRTFYPSGFFARQCSSIGSFSIVYLNRGTRDEKRDEETVRSRRIKRSILPLAGVFSFAKSEAKRVNEIRIPYPDVASRRPTTTTRFTVSHEQDPTL